MVEAAIAKQHKNNHLFQLLADQIRDGRLEPGDRLPPERELAAKYKCSRDTVRSCLALLEKSRRIHRRQGSGTYVSQGEESPANQLKTIAIIISTDKTEIDDDPYLTQILMGMQNICSRYTCNFNIIKAGMNDDLETALNKKKLQLNNFDGYLFLDYRVKDPEIARLQQQGIPFTACVPAAGDKVISCVEIDNAGGIYVAANHLLSLNRRNIHLLTETASSELKFTKRQGFAKALNEHGIAARPEMIREAVPNEPNLAHDQVKELLQQRDAHPCDALIVCGDWATYGAVQAIREAGLKIPQDIALIMHDDFPWVSKVLNLPITAVRQPFNDQAGRALTLLLRQMDDKNEKVNVIEILQPQLIVRKSCGVAL